MTDGKLVDELTKKMSSEFSRKMSTAQISKKTDNLEQQVKATDLKVDEFSNKLTTSLHQTSIHCISLKTNQPRRWRKPGY